MRLTAVKLSGFKSFVDPTTLSLPANFTVVVGPNGCGKSNIIDAVRWVMGESSAGRLRGDALTDVIFSGSASRKPVSQATVELVFDNSDRQITGEFAAYDEISVKRRVDRDGNSDYFLNGSRCRKRDITDLFLGTGLGPRSYAIIEQGMISQVIDAKPEALRAHLEEAAGITLYKERRRETLSRIGQTRENLERLADLRGEIARQLEHLRVQAEQASQYRQWQEQRQQVQGQILALQYRAADQQRRQLLGTLSERQAAVDAALAQIQQLDAAQSAPVQQLQAAQQALEQAQAGLYACQAEQTRLEQALAHAQALTQRQQAEQAQADDGLLQLEEQLQRDQHDAGGLQQALDALAPLLAEAAGQREQAQQALGLAHSQREQWQQQWDQASRRLHEASSALTRETTRNEFLGRQQQQLAQRQQAQAQELAQLRARHDAGRLGQAGQALADAAALLARAEQCTHTAAAARQLAEKAQHDADAGLQQQRGRQQVLAGQLAALQTLQAAALGSDDAAGQDWLAGQGLEQAPRLGSLLQVQPGWESAVETVLGPWLQAVVVPSAQRGLLQAQWPGPGSLHLADADAAGQIAVPDHSLASKVAGPALARWLLARVGLPGTAAEGMDWQLDADGILLARHGSCVGLHGGVQGSLVREQQLRDLQHELEAAQQALALAQQADNDARQQVSSARGEEQQALAGLDQARQQHVAAKAALTVLQAQHDDAQRALARAEAGHADLQTQQQQLESEQAELAQALAAAGQAQQQAQAQVDALAGERPQRDAAAELAQRQLGDSRDRQQALVLQRETGQARSAALAQALQRGRAQQQALRTRLEQLGQAHADQAGQLEQLALAGRQAQAAAAQAAATLAQAQSQHEQARQAAEQAVTHRQQRQQWLDEQREQLLQLRLQLQAAELALEHAREQAAQAQLVLEDALTQLPADAQAGPLARQLRQLDARLDGLGAVNLAAIEEFEQASQRHAWLQGQHDDLTAALETLETAMARIDRETRGRFKETFDKVNAGLQDLYPRLFGGGQAWLELTSNDLLEAGVSLMARPPGKKVSTLSLLSGGEKAMTAVALVFAIFQLNPAPFCLLDEVDAPLDEANVGRLAQMLQQMSGDVQFLSVSHNKATMEAADQLCGVTMREAGVSRLVSVDLGQATQLAGAA